MTSKVRLRLLNGSYAISRLSPTDPIPAWADGDGFVSISRTDDELSIVCLGIRVPSSIEQDNEWSCFKFEGPFAFDETGIIQSVIQPLSSHGIGILVISTFNGDHLLVKTGELETTVALLIDAGHAVA